MGRLRSRIMSISSARRSETGEGKESRAQIVIPDGFEYTVADIGSGTSKNPGPCIVDIQDQVTPSSRTCTSAARHRSRDANGSAKRA